MSMLLFEITLMRISSITFTYHYSFVAVSLALFGTGVGSAITNMLPLRAKKDPTKLILPTAILSIVSIQAGTLLSITLLSGENLTGFFLIMSVPFLFWGSCISMLFRSYTSQSGSIYAANLFGSAIGTITSLLFIDYLGGVNTALISGVIYSIGTLFIVSKVSKDNHNSRRIYVILLVLIAVTASMTQLSLSNDSWMVPVGNNPNKELNQFLREGWEIVDTRWSAFGRTDVVEHESIDNRKIVFIDGSAGSIMYSFDGVLSESQSDPNHIKNSTAYFPYYFGQKEQVLIIGPGAGKDVLVALMGGGNEITGVEINRRITEIVEDYSEYNGYIYTNYSNVRVVFDEGRSYLTRSDTQYDLIILTLPVTLTIQGSSGYSLAENFLFTKEAISDYLDHLTDEGRLVVVSHSISHVYKLVTTTLSTPIFNDSQDIMGHIAIAAEFSPDKTSYRFPVFILKKTEFTSEESAAMFSKAKELGFMPLFFPHIGNEESDIVLSMIESGFLEEGDLISLSVYDLSPPTDNRPFFYKFEKTLPENFTSLMNVSIIFSLLILVIPSINKNMKSDTQRSRKRAKGSQLPRLPFLLVYVSLLGIIYILVEYALIQKFILFLGNPTYANTVTLAILLISSGLGSLFSNKFEHRALLKKIPQALLVAGLLSMLYVLIVPFILTYFLGSGFLFRVFICFLLTFPLGFFMGIPFPSSIRLIGNAYQDYVPWLYGVDSVFSVLGIILGVYVALSYGFNGVLILGGVGYLLTYLIYSNVTFR